ncbi:MAG TPA: hypothetical protein PLP21_13150 [Pyrinomonadaceae bacterium]|nr:hypothetical protein [Acidobacteriota bacterium]HQZ97262.1 hypothetical protein [Pyrinomonadaceae bacterium]
MRYGYQSSNVFPVRRSGVANGARSEWRKKFLTPRVCSVAAGLGIFGGISFLFAGLVCVILHEIIQGDALCNQIGTGLLISAIPMILLGSVFLDEIKVR